MKKVLAIVTLTLLLATQFYKINQKELTDFEKWSIRFGQYYGESENIYRQNIYNQNKKMIEEHNNDETQTYKMGENQFMTLTKEEYIGLYLSQPDLSHIQEQKKIKQQSTKDTKKSLKGPIPNGVDYSSYVSVKDQKQCSAGWAFAITNQVEAFMNQYYNQTFLNWEVSAQQQIDCATQYRGCLGQEDRYQAINYIISNGYQTSASYGQYLGYQQNCQKWGGSKNISNYEILLTVEDVILALIYQTISVEVDASNWQFYSTGIFSSCSSDFNYYNHHALLVGFDSGLNWKVLNSFGKSWGEQGYIRLAPGNTCGLANWAYKVYGVWESARL